MIGPTNALTVTGTVDPGSVTVGSDLKPVKLVNGVATAVANDLVSTTGTQNITGLKTIVNNFQISNRGALIFTDSNTRAIRVQNAGYADRTTNPSSNITCDFLRYEDTNTFAVLAMAQTVKTNGERKFVTALHNGSGLQNMTFGSDSFGGDTYLTTHTRAYNASNTDDVVTIGTLQASTDVVHRSGDEIVSGTKVFNNLIKATTATYQGYITAVGDTEGTYTILAKLGTANDFNLNVSIVKRGGFFLGNIAGNSTITSIVKTGLQGTGASMKIYMALKSGNMYLVARRITAAGQGFSCTVFGAVGTTAYIGPAPQAESEILSNPDTLTEVMTI